MKKIFFAIVLSVLSGVGFAQSIDLPTPAGSVAFGTSVTVLPNGNYVVTDPRWRNATDTNVGAVYLYNGQTNALISKLTGSQSNDQVGNFGITVVGNSNYVVRSIFWSNGVHKNAGAVTWCNGSLGVNSEINSSNSLVGTQSNDYVGLNGVYRLAMGNYAVGSQYWANGTQFQAGAVTWCSGATGLSGTISSTNSLVGTVAGDNVGYSTTVLSTGHFIVCSPFWSVSASILQSGAITWCSGTSGLTGAVSATNSLVSRLSYFHLGINNDLTPLTNGSYVVSNPNWSEYVPSSGYRNQLGFVSWGSSTGGVTGNISNNNSIIGNNDSDRIGSGGIAVLTNGNFVIASPKWANGSNKRAGAVTWSKGTTSLTGVVSSSNSLVGSLTDDNVGWNVATLSNGNYVVASPDWNNSAGAATWGNGLAGTSGIVSANNSIVGIANSGSRISSDGITALSNGNYIVNSSSWSSGTKYALGASTWANGTITTGTVVDSSNSIVGSQSLDKVGNFSTLELANGNYLVRSTEWSNGLNFAAGAVTWGNGFTGTSCVVDSSNSIIGSTLDDRVGNAPPRALSNGHYVISSPQWDNGVIKDAGAVTWGNGVTGSKGIVGVTNSLIGSQANDYVGYGGVFMHLPVATMLLGAPIGPMARLLKQEPQLG